jgi:hypothetical protein
MLRDMFYASHLGRDALRTKLSGLGSRQEKRQKPAICRVSRDHPSSVGCFARMNDAMDIDFECYSYWRKSNESSPAYVRGEINVTE